MAEDHVTWEHPEYKAQKGRVKVCNDVYDGIDTSRHYLSKLRNEYDDSFLIRQEEATLDNFIERIVKTMAGQITRKAPLYEGMMPNLETDMDNVAENESLTQFAKDITERAILDGKTYVLVDIPMDGGDPYFANVLRSNVINWEKDSEGNYTMVVILEAYKKSTGQFSFEVKPQYRVIDEVGNVQIWRKVENDGWVVVEEITTSYNFCPFYEFNIQDVPPLYDIALINLKHMNFTSLKDRFTREALDPILFGQNLGIDNAGTEENPTIVIGVNQMMSTDNPDSGLSWVELDGSNYEIAEKNLLKMEDDIGARALKLKDESNKAKTATQVSEENSESTSRISDIADDLETILNLIVNAYSMMKYNRENSGYITANKDFNSAATDSNTITALNTLEVSNNITKRTLLKALNDTEAVIIDDIDEELQELEANALAMDAVVSNGGV